MSKPIVPPAREKNGRKLRKSTQDALNEIAAKERAEVIGLVTRQPHRKDFPDPSAQIVGCAIGRFVTRHHMAAIIVDAADTYATARRKWRAARGVPTEVRMDGNGGDFDPDTVRKLFDTWKSIESAIATVAGQNALSLINGAAFSDMEIPENHHVPNIKIVLIEMAYSTGHLVRPRGA